MIIKGLKAIEKHMASLHARDVSKRPWFYDESEDDPDYNLELTGYQEVGAAAGYFEIPNR